MKKFLAVLMLSAFLPVFASAAPAKKAVLDSTNDTVEPDKGDGCGLGWQVTQKRTMIATTTRGTTNAFVPPTFGMTSGTIGCEQHNFAKNEEEAVRYVASNQDMILMEMAAGQGEYLAALAGTLGCSGAEAQAFGAASQAQISDLSGQSAVQMYRGVKAIAQSTGCMI